MKVYENAPVIGIRCAQIDPTVELKIRRDVNKHLAIILGSLFFSAGGLFQLLGEGEKSGSVLTWLGLIMFGGGAIGFSVNILFRRRAPLVLSTKGLRDYRVSKNIIPWANIQRVGWTTLGQLNRVVFIKVTPETIASLEVHRLGRWLNRLSAKMGGKTIYIQGNLEPSIEELVEIISQYARNYNPDFESSEN